MPATIAPAIKHPEIRMNRLFAEHGGRMVVEWTPPSPMSDEQLLQFCQENEGLRIEQNSEGDLIIMPPVGAEGSNRNFKIFRCIKR